MPLAPSDFDAVLVSDPDRAGVAVIAAALAKDGIPFARWYDTGPHGRLFTIGVRTVDLSRAAPIATHILERRNRMTQSLPSSSPPSTEDPDDSPGGIDPMTGPLSASPLRLPPEFP